LCWPLHLSGSLSPLHVFTHESHMIGQSSVIAGEMQAFC
jgi:hypothetical protein